MPRVLVCEGVRFFLGGVTIVLLLIAVFAVDDRAGPGPGPGAFAEMAQAILGGVLMLSTLGYYDDLPGWGHKEEDW